jgi:hypothetical protein
VPDHFKPASPHIAARRFTAGELVTIDVGEQHTLAQNGFAGITR